MIVANQGKYNKQAKLQSSLRVHSVFFRDLFASDLFTILKKSNMHLKGKVIKKILICSLSSTLDKQKIFYE